MAAIASSLVRKLRPKRNGTTSLPKLDPLEKEDVDSLVTPQEFAENFLKSEYIKVVYTENSLMLNYVCFYITYSVMSTS